VTANSALDLQPQVPFAYQMIARVAARHGFTLNLDPFGGTAARLEAPGGKVVHFRHGNHDANGSGSSDIARDKQACGYFLAKAGISVPTSHGIKRGTADDPVIRQRLLDFAAVHGWPLVVKPNSLYGGRGVEFVTTTRGLDHAVTRALDLDKIALVQPFIAGHDLRVVIYAGKLAAAYVRVPPAVLGDGANTIRQLLDHFYTDPDCLPDRAECVIRLARHPGGLERIPDVGDRVRLIDAANIEAGASPIDISDTVAPEIINLAVHATRASGLLLAGVDIIADGLALPSLPQNTPSTSDKLRCTVLEINSAPELEGFASLGSEQEQRVFDLYEQIVLEMVSR
jgi:glutathione synthase/RimK-type ligase-like ATP-grasp enzyme